MSILVSNLNKTIGDPATSILENINLEIKTGDFVALTGRSGSGKSSLLYLLSTLDKPTQGRLEIAGKDISKLSTDELHRFRNQELGFVFQFHYLIAELSALENVLLPTRKFGLARKKTQEALELLEQVGLASKSKRLPRTLSGGEQQRVAIARSLIMKPSYLFADEPTGSLDTLNGKKVMQTLQSFNQRFGSTLVLVTHDPTFAHLASRQILLVDGSIVQESEKSK